MSERKSTPSERRAFAGLKLSRRAVNALLEAGITTPEEAAAMPARDLLSLRCFGPESLAVLRASVPPRPGEG
jgi:DNA-directed RNA polymerase alpha subunit